MARRGGQALGTGPTLSLSGRRPEEAAPILPRLRRKLPHYLLTRWARKIWGVGPATPTAPSFPRGRGHS